VKEIKMDNKLTSNKLFNPLIKWLDSFYDTVENTSLFQEDDELTKKFGVVSNNFDIREIKEDKENTEIPDIIKDSMGDNEEIIQLEHEEFLEMIGFTPEQIEEDRRTVQIIDYNVFFSTEKEKNTILLSLRSMLENLIKTYNLKVSHLIKNENLLEKAIETEFLANGGTITFIHDGENITKEFIFPEEE
jgi:cell fate regulator YaaT (PSP1 superfamily)